MSKSFATVFFSLFLTSFYFAHFVHAITINPPHSLYGTVNTNGNPIDVTQDKVQVQISEIVIAEGKLILNDPQIIYLIDIPGDDPQTSVKDGGQDGDTLVLWIGGLKAQPSTSWQGGVNERLDLTLPLSDEVPTPAPTLRQQTPPPNPTAPPSPTTSPLLKIPPPTMSSSLATITTSPTPTLTHQGCRYGLCLIVPGAPKQGERTCRSEQDCVVSTPSPTLAEGTDSTRLDLPTSTPTAFEDTGSIMMSTSPTVSQPTSAPLLTPTAIGTPSSLISYPTLVPAGTTTPLAEMLPDTSLKSPTYTSFIGSIFLLIVGLFLLKVA